MQPSTGCTSGTLYPPIVEYLCPARVKHPCGVINIPGFLIWHSTWTCWRRRSPVANCLWPRGTRDHRSYATHSSLQSDVSAPRITELFTLLWNFFFPIKTTCTVLTLLNLLYRVIIARRECVSCCKICGNVLCGYYGDSWYLRYKDRSVVEVWNGTWRKLRALFAAACSVLPV